jgi:ribosome maturation factor RimP
MSMGRRHEALAALLQPAVEAVGMQLWGIEYLPQRRHSVLRLYIDSDHGVTVDDCERVSHQVSAVLDVEDPIQNEYTLEVSSPGLDRQLFNLEQLMQFVGAEMRVRLRVAIAGKRQFSGRLEKVESNTLWFGLGQDNLEIPYSQIDKANLIPRYEVD